VNFAIAENISLRVSSKNRTAKSGCATEIRCEWTPEMGRAAGGGAGRSWGVGKFKKKVVVEPELPGLVRWADQTQENQHSEHRDAGYDNHRRPRAF
jgi:hypothetical protein